jgi:predicted aldo/keto reductase-like oxidoreductase
MLWLRTLKKAYDMQGYGEMRYNLLGNGGHWFPGKNAADVEGLDLGATAERAGFKAEALRSLLKETHELLGKQEVKRLSQS